MKSQENGENGHHADRRSDAAAQSGGVDGVGVAMELPVPQQMYAKEWMAVMAEESLPTQDSAAVEALEKSSPSKATPGSWVRWFMS